MVTFERLPSKPELKEFLEKQVAEARRMNEPERVDYLLDQLTNLDETHRFLEQVAGTW